MAYPSPMGHHGFLSGILAARPAFGVAERLYWATDTFTLFRDTGAAWEVIAYGRVYQRIICNRFAANWGANENSVANRAWGSFYELRQRSTINRLGLSVGAEVQTGNMQLGIYGPYPSFARVCTTAAIAVAGLTINIWNWFDPSTTPDAPAGLYLLVGVCDTVYAGGVSGMRFGTASIGTDIRDYLDLEADGYQNLVRMDAAYPLPDPFVPVNHQPNNLIAVAARVTPIV